MIEMKDHTFVGFVNHTQMVEQKLYQSKECERNCNVMLLIKDKIKGNESLIQIESNPWLSSTDSEKDEVLITVKQSQQQLNLELKDTRFDVDSYD